MIVIDWISLSFFTAEVLVKTIAFGLYPEGDKTYFKVRGRSRDVASH